MISIFLKLSTLNKRAVFRGLMTKYLKSFEFNFQQRKNIEQIFDTFFADVGRKTCLFYFFLYEVIDQLYSNNYTMFEVI